VVGCATGAGATGVGLAAAGGAAAAGALVAGAGAVVGAGGVVGAADGAAEGPQAAASVIPPTPATRPSARRLLIVTRSVAIADLLPSVRQTRMPSVIPEPISS
jgi:hypothetical protein